MAHRALCCSLSLWRTMRRVLMVAGQLKLNSKIGSYIPLPCKRYQRYTQQGRASGSLLPRKQAALTGRHADKVIAYLMRGITPVIRCRCFSTPRRCAFDRKTLGQNKTIAQELFHHPRRCSSKVAMRAGGARIFEDDDCKRGCQMRKSIAAGKNGRYRVRVRLIFASRPGNYAQKIWRRSSIPL